MTSAIRSNNFGIFIVSAAFLFFSRCAIVGASEVEVSSLSSTSTSTNRHLLGGAWDGKSETEVKSTLDKKGRGDGYEIQSDFELARLLWDNWGPMTAATWRRFDRKNLDYAPPSPVSPGAKPGKKVVAAVPVPESESRNYIDEASLGARGFFPVLGAKWQSDWLIHRIWEEADRKKDGYSSYLSWEVKARYYLGSRAKAKIRYRYIEYLRDRSGDSVDKRQSKLELTPSIFYRYYSAGLQNRLINKFKGVGGLSTIDMSPYLKYERDALEFTLKVIFVPFVSNDGRLWAQGWAQRPIYSADLQVNL